MSPFEAAVQYHVDCERYDRLVCTGPMGKDGILPANGRQQDLISIHAKQKFAEMCKKAEMAPTEFIEIVRSDRAIDEANRRLSANTDKE